MQSFINYYKPFLEKTYIFHGSTLPLDYPDRNECVFMVPGSVRQMQDDMEHEDWYDTREVCFWSQKK